MSAIVARRPVVVGRGQQGAPRGYHRDAHLGAGALDDLLGASKLEGRKEFSIRKYFKVFPGPANSNHLFDVRVIRRQFLITNRPVLFNSFQASLAEIAFRKPEAVGIPMDAPATYTTNPVDANPVAVLVTDCLGHFGWITGAGLLPVWEFVRPGVIIKLLAPDLAARFDKSHLGAAFGKLFGQNPSRRP